MQARSKIVQRKRRKSRWKGTKAAISCSVTQQCEKLTASPTSFRSSSCTSVPIVLSKYYFFFLSLSLSIYIFFCKCHATGARVFVKCETRHARDSMGKKEPTTRTEIKIYCLKGVLTVSNDGNILWNVFRYRLKRPRIHLTNHMIDVRL